MFEKVERARAPGPLEDYPIRVLAKLPKEKPLSSFFSCVRERRCLGEARVLDGDVRMTTVRSRSISGKFWSTLENGDGFFGLPGA